ncbi:exodeoxyribonuclease VII large subunit [Pseudodesulfovibrio cashew]|uniref:Exodeoxyribonuclease 7 large subunit n=1 Tax=Pseudodesulfovibrio cashew TaxID=2678688 RepID=A0A6I6JE09_9BACT|nr:exodeoxyribonuclease VII large subunit [Pseudodesulfovibrio cashew]QGY38873.1 exodeoxyribonuclease VII large subunit [Pseudodesulfovibrio cashew]
MSAIFTVSELTRSVKNLLEAEFPFVWVRGQVSNLARPASGHIYFTLTDGDAALSVVWFKSAQAASQPVTDGGERINPLTGEVEETAGTTALSGSGLEEGMEVLCAGRLNVYEPRGQYQLVAELVQDQGVGDLAIAFEALKKKLSEKGYFDEDRKMAIPRNPKRVAVITSPSGAAIRDFLRIADTRGTGAEIRIYPSLVQGDLAPEQLAKALDQADAEGWAEVAVLIRGGGSLEDLWAFNTEPVADAIYRSRLPVVTGVGHEPDVSIADFVADKRAATPSHAAQELWPRRETLAQRLDDLELAMTRAYTGWLLSKGTDFEHLRRALVWLSPERRLERMSDRYAGLLTRLEDAGQDLIFNKHRDARDCVERLGRAYGPGRMRALSAETASWVRRMSNAYNTRRTEDTARQTGALVQRLRTAMERLAEDRSQELKLADTALSGLNPEAPLERGYALIRVERTGQFLRNPKEVTNGDALAIRVREGNVTAVVTSGGSTFSENK